MIYKGNTQVNAILKDGTEFEEQLGAKTIMFDNLSAEYIKQVAANEKLLSDYEGAVSEASTYRAKAEAYDSLESRYNSLQTRYDTYVAEHPEGGSDTDDALEKFLSKQSTEVTFPTNTFDDYVCMNQSKLETVSYKRWVSDVTNSIGSYAFYSCSSLETFEPYDLLSYIGEGAFKNCTRLKTAIIPDAVTGTTGNVFQGCTSLEWANIPYSVTYLGSFAFASCESLKWVMLHANKVVSTTGSNTIFNGCTSLESIYVPDDLVDTYKNNSTWKSHASIFKPLSDVE